jgi:hypothetical protein
MQYDTFTSGFEKQKEILKEILHGKTEKEKVLLEVTTLL